MKSLTHGHLKAGINAVRNAKMRSFWTMLGVIIGVASVITVVSIGEGVKQQISGQIHHFGGNVITVRPTQLQTSSDSGSSGLNLLSGLNITAPLTAKDVAAVKKTKGVSASAPLTIATGSVKSENGPYTDGFVIGTTGDLPRLINQSLSYGSFLIDGEDEGSNVAVLGQHAVDKMFDVDVPLGHSFTFHGETFIVKGIFNTFSTTPLSQQADFNNAIFIPNDVAESLNKNTAPTYAILARSSNNQKVDQVSSAVKQSLARSRGSDKSFAVLTGDQNLETSDSVLNLLTRLIAGIAAISLLVGGVGIMNVMLVSVAERMHEIGIRKAIGATNRQILSQFVIESSVLTLTGGIIGIIVALIANVALRMFTNLKPAMSWEIVVVATVVSLLVGVIFGSVPAIKAARKDPIDALRSE
jgi:ABC-type antimicrobial peptide transport system permease subunit